MKWLRLRGLRVAVALSVLALVLVGLDALCYQFALPIALDVAANAATLHVDGQTFVLGTMDRPVAIAFAPHDPVVHEFQLDDTDSANNFSLDTTYLHAIATSPYYRLQSWMRDLNGTSRWRDLAVWTDGHLAGTSHWPPNDTRFFLPQATTLHVTLALQRPETSMTFSILTTDDMTWTITLDRNDRAIAVTRTSAILKTTVPVIHTYFPLDPLPFAAMVLDFLARTLLWSLVALSVVVVLDTTIVLLLVSNAGVTGRLQAGWQWLWGRWRRPQPLAPESPAPQSWALLPPGGRRRLSPFVRMGRGDHDADSQASEAAHSGDTQARHAAPLQYVPGVIAFVGRQLRQTYASLTRAIHPLGLVALALSFAFVLWIALVQYHAEPHIYDASAYLWGARVYASGHLTAPTPPASDRFPGPFMIDHAGQRFTQYMPGTSATLALGVLVGAPWLVEPLLGTLALLGIGLIAARLYDRRVATLAVVLGTLSPFYSYLAASYMSHAITLFYLVWGSYLLLRFAQGGASWHLPGAAALFGIAWLTRDMALLFALIASGGAVVLVWRQLRVDWWRWLFYGALTLIVALSFWLFSFAFNVILTGEPTVSARMLFAPDDKIGFGPGIGFYGQHTLAAGLVIVDQLLTSLSIDLFGWPFYLTLAVLAIPFLAWRARAVDWFMLVGAALLTGVWALYFYHGIYLGPRFLFEALPFYLILTARGIIVLAQVGSGVAGHVKTWLYQPVAALKPTMSGVSIGTLTLVIVLLACNLLYFMPRQIVVHNNFTGLPAGYTIDLASLYHPPLRNAIVITGDYMTYEYILFPLNDPYLHASVIYALAATPKQIVELEAAFPQRAIYQLLISANGQVSYLRL